MAELSNEFLLACRSECTGTASCASWVARGLQIETPNNVLENNFTSHGRSHNSPVKDHSHHDILINTACSPRLLLPDLALDKLIFLTAQFIISSAVGREKFHN